RTAGAATAACRRARRARRWVQLCRPCLTEAGEAVGAPLFRADSVVHEEQAVRVVSPLDWLQAWLVVAEVGLLPVPVEVIAFGDVRAGLGCDFAQLVGRQLDRRGGLVRRLEIHRLRRYGRGGGV